MPPLKSFSHHPTSASAPARWRGMTSTTSCRQPRPASASPGSAIVLLSLLVMATIPGCRSISSEYDSAPKMFFASREGLVEAVKGQTVSLPCKFVVNDASKATINKDKKTLTFNRNPVEDVTRLRVIPSSIQDQNEYNLEISDVQAYDEGLYRCIASFETQFFVKNITLLVKVPPYFIGPLADDPITLTEGERSELVCNAGGSPAPTVTWYKLVEPPFVKEMNRDKIAVGVGPRYVMDNVTRSCQGSFICIASSDPTLPSASRRFNITVQYKPTVSLVNEEISQRRGRTTMVMCVITGNPLEEFYWQHRALLFKPSGSGSCESTNQKHCIYTSSASGGVVKMDLMIKNLTAEDFGTYDCVAKSRLGMDRKTANVLEVSNDFSTDQRPDTVPQVFKPQQVPAQAEVDEAQPEINTRQPPWPAVSSSATDSGEGGNKHAPGSTLYGTKAASQSPVATTSICSLLGAASSLLLLRQLVA